MRKCTLSVGIVVYRCDGEMLLGLLESLVASVRKAAANRVMDVGVYVVCNDQAADGGRLIADLVRRFNRMVPVRMRCELIEGHGNIGYGAAQNLAIRRSSADFYLALNPDVVLAAGAIDESIHFLDAHPDTVMVVPQGYDGDGRYASLAKRAPSVLVLLLRALSVRPSRGFPGRLVGRYIYADRLPSEHPQSVDLASGCFMFCRRSALQAEGGFDERYFLYFEDYDLSRRIAGHGQICEVPDVRIVHHGGRTAHRGLGRIARFIRSGIRYFNTYGWRIL